MLSCDGSSMTLAWKSPKHCGGSKVNAYYIDKRDADTLVWKEVNLEAITERICTVSGISNTQNYTALKLLTKTFIELIVCVFMFSCCRYRCRPSQTMRSSVQVFTESNNHTFLSLQVDNLTEGTFYEFKVQAANLAGVGVPSAPSAAMKCEAWTMEQPGRRTTTASHMIQY